MKTTPATVSDLINLAIETKVAGDVVEHLLDYARWVDEKSAEKAYYQALLEFQSKCPVIEKTKPVRDRLGNLLYKYAPLDILLPQVQPLLTECGFIYSFSQKQDEEKVTALCVLGHVGGFSTVHQQEGRRIGKTGAMSDGQVDVGTSTFLRGRAFCHALGILTGEEDIDGNLPEQKEVKADLISVDDLARLSSLIVQLEIDPREVCVKAKVLTLAEMKSTQAKRFIIALEKQMEKQNGE